jgi:hypothetical protein
LREIYAAKGVHFSGQNALDGGAILDQDSNFGIDAPQRPQLPGL